MQNPKNLVLLAHCADWFCSKWTWQIIQELWWSVKDGLVHWIHIQDSKYGHAVGKNDFGLLTLEMTFHAELVQLILSQNDSEPEVQRYGM